MLRGGKEEKRSENAQKNEQKRYYKSNSTATDLLLEVQDIRDELNILNDLLTQQQYVWARLLDRTRDEYGIINWNDSSRNEVEKWKMPGFAALKEVIEMDKKAQSIQDSVCIILFARLSTDTGR